MAERITLVPGPDYAAGLTRFVDTLRAGGVVAFATDTVWGIGALARHTVAVERIFDIKGRDDTRPVACLVRDSGMARQIAEHWDDEVEALTRRHWPGALTVVVRAPGRFPAAQRGRDTLGLRVPDRPVVRAVLDALGEPLAASSANLSGQPELANADDVAATLRDSIDLIVDDRMPVSGQASTVLEWNGMTWLVLRQGAVLLHGPKHHE